jgi:hypothetical protein
VRAAGRGNAIVETLREEAERVPIATSMSRTLGRRPSRVAAAAWFSPLAPGPGVAALLPRREAMRSTIVLLLGVVLALGGLVGACSESGNTDPGCDPACGVGQLCVLFYDGQCNPMGRASCVTTSCGLQCDSTGGAAGPCTLELCNAGVAQDGGSPQFVCGEACGREPPDTFACYGW